jgi:hypothetical protein
MHYLAFSIHVAPLAKTIVALGHLHPLVEIDLLPFANDFHPKTNLVLGKEAFIYVFTHSRHISSGGPLGMVYELL